MYAPSPFSSMNATNVFLPSRTMPEETPDLASSGSARRNVCRMLPDAITPSHSILNHASSEGRSYFYTWRSTTFSTVSFSSLTLTVNPPLHFEKSISTRPVR